MKLNTKRRRYDRNVYKDTTNDIIFTETMKLKFIHKN